MLSVEHRDKGEVVSAAKFDDFDEVAGMWWARRIVLTDAEGHRRWSETQTVTEVSAEDFTKRMTEELAGKDRVILLPQPVPKVAEAKAAVTIGKATFTDHAVLTLHFAASQRWSRALDHLQECERLAAGKPGMLWLRDAFLTASRRNEELRKRLLEEAASLAATTAADTRANDGFLAETMFTEVERVLQSSELLELSDVLKKVYERQLAHLHAMKMWRTRQVSLLHAKRPPTNSLPASRRCENRRNRHPIFAHSICWNCSSNDVRRNS